MCSAVWRNNLERHGILDVETSKSVESGGRKKNLVTVLKFRLVRECSRKTMVVFIEGLRLLIPTTKSPKEHIDIILYENLAVWLGVKLTGEASGRKPLKED
mmetsp:Transcript_35952/g.60898  ORF Transcript_35952/g.60898 Transcript_35952/m.60898 type:complete len:101 (-) Transcript_35952:8-310(-)